MESNSQSSYRRKGGDGKKENNSENSGTLRSLPVDHLNGGACNVDTSLQKQL